MSEQRKFMKRTDLLVILVLMAVMHESLIRKIAKTKQAA